MSRDTHLPSDDDDFGLEDDHEYEVDNDFGNDNDNDNDNDDQVDDENDDDPVDENELFVDSRIETSRPNDDDGPRVPPRTDPQRRAATLAQPVSVEALFDFLPRSPHDHAGERLQKVLARVGVGSRRAIEDLIADGRVRVNGEVAVLGRRVEADRDQITIDGAPVGTAAGLVYYLLNKPSGVVTTASDPHGRTTVVDLVPEEPRVFPVGRLDVETEGLLLLTNDGELAHRLTHPSFGVVKEYLAEVRGTPSSGALRRLREGVELDDGMTAPAQASSGGPNLVRIAIHEGRNRQVRRMLDAVGHPVVRLVRVRIDTLVDRTLPPGEWRHLTTDEVMALSRAVAEPNQRPRGNRSTPQRTPRSSRRR